jgi:hypothetical protein
LQSGLGHEPTGHRYLLWTPVGDQSIGGSDTFGCFISGVGAPILST